MFETIKAAGDVQMDEATLRAMDKAIRAGTFKRITSVAIARHGEMIHEVYYHGDAEIRRGEPASAESDSPLSLEELLRGQDSDR